MKPQNRILDLENLLSGGIAQELIRCLFWNSRVYLERQQDRNHNVDFLAQGQVVHGEPRWWWIEVKSGRLPKVAKEKLDEKLQLNCPSSKVIHVNYSDPPYIRVRTFPYEGDESGYVHFTQTLRADEEFRFDPRVYSYYEERARVLLLIPRLTRSPDLLVSLASLVDAIREESGDYEAPST